MPRWRRRHWDHFRDCRAAASAFAAEDADGEWVELLKEAAPSPPNRKVKGVRLRVLLTSRTLTRIMSPGFHDLLVSERFSSRMVVQSARCEASR